MNINNKHLESIVNKTGLMVISDFDADFKGNFRLIKMTKNNV